MLLRALRHMVLAAVTLPDILAALAEMTAAPSPRGAEGPAAERLRVVAARRWPGLPWATVRGEGGAASLRSHSAVGSAHEAPELLIYSHLDTSLTGFARHDAPLTGEEGEDPPTGIRVAGGRVRGFGLGVARAPAAAALTGYASAAQVLRANAIPHRLTLLLAGAGTHRSAAGGEGLASHAAEPGALTELAQRGSRSAAPPAGVLVATCGPPGLLYEEPGSAFVRVRLRGRMTPALAPESATPPGGLPTHAGLLCAAIDRWRAALLAEPWAASGQTAREVAIGALTSGSPGKPDLLPAVLDAHVYLVTTPEDSAAALAQRLHGHLAATLGDGPLRGCALTVTLAGAQPGGRTHPQAPVVGAARRAWQDAYGRPAPEARTWRGSTDGVLFRAAGIDTVRTGPASAADEADPRLDVLPTTELLRFARLYACTAMRWAADDGESARVTTRGE